MRFAALLFLCSSLLSQQLYIPFDSSGLPPGTFYEFVKYDMILLGEIHGTKEAPVMAFQICQILGKAGKKVALALELPAEEEPALSNSGNAERFRNSPFFMETRDGRSGEAMAGLIDSCIQSGIPFHCFVPSAQSHSHDHDSLMAMQLIRIRNASPEAIIVVLCGNLHTRLRRDYSRKDKAMGTYLKSELQERIISLDIRFAEGAAYNRTKKGSGIHHFITDTSVFRSYLKAGGYLLIDPAFEALGYNGVIYLRKGTASLPYMEQTGVIQSKKQEE